MAAGALLALAGCASTMGEVPLQRATVGPGADEIFTARFARGYARLPSFDETNKFRDDLDRRVGDYLAKNPQIATSPRASQFRFERRVDVGMSKPEVTLLLGPPDLTTDDRAVMQANAGLFWPEIGRRAQEMWRYPSGWSLYFEGDRLVDLTVKGKQPIE
ncbi:MAG TPA: hypothetical protein VJU81_16505 [Methylomirabilota bacterium]|nr:hypothetical protein [Methylomirabilota bacterium]